MKVVFSEHQLRHFPQSYLSSGAKVANPEVPERAERLLDAAARSGLVAVEPQDRGDDVIYAVHSRRYVEFLQTIHVRWSRIAGASEEVLPNVHPLSRSDGYPDSAVGHVGWHVYDSSCPISAHTWLSARWSAQAAAEAAHLVADGEPWCYALCRPPGHHASQDLAGGFCYLNNTAIAASVLRARYPRISVIDVDVHHGNGTQRIFYERSDVQTVSLHADPVRFYPFFWGYGHENGADAGVGYNHNFPLPRGTNDDDYLLALDAALDKIIEYSPGALVVALGLDAHEGDPFRGMAITTQGFARIAARLAALRLPTVVVQEGGYLSDDLGPNLSSFLTAFAQSKA